jgi:hypothetical protein
MWNSATLLSIIAWWSLVATAVFGGLAVITGLIGGVAATRASDIKSMEDAKKIADADARAAEANARAEEAKADAAKAHQRAEEAGVEAEKVKERLQKSREMRQLTKPQADAMMPLLKSDLFQNEPKPWIMVSHVSDAEAESFARQLCNFIYSCGARVRPLSEAWQTVPSKTDIAFVVRTNEPTPENQPFTRLSHVMQNNGISIGLTVDPSKKPNELDIIVLRKPDLEDDILVQTG